MSYSHRPGLTTPVKARKTYKCRTALVSYKKFEHETLQSKYLIYILPLFKLHLISVCDEAILLSEYEYEYIQVDFFLAKMNMNIFGSNFLDEYEY